MPPRFTDGLGRRRPSDSCLGCGLFLTCFPCNAAQFATGQTKIGQITVAQRAEFSQCFAVYAALGVAQGRGFQHAASGGHQALDDRTVCMCVIDICHYLLDFLSCGIRAALLFVL